MLKKKLLAFFVIASFLSSFMLPKAHGEAVYKAEKFPLQEMQIQVMPEFDYPKGWSRDTPSLLVGLYGTITNKSGQNYNGNIEFPVHANDKDFLVNLVAEFPDPNKPEVQRTYNVDKANGVISWKPQKPLKNNATYKFVIEYYTKSIQVKNGTKSFTYQFSNPADINQLNVIFYTPMNAKNVHLDPNPQNNEKSDFGEVLYYYQYQNVKKGSYLNYTFSYQKSGTDSSMEDINKQQAPNDSTHTGINSGNTAKNNQSSTSQPIIGIGGALIIGIAIIIAGVFVYLSFKGRQKTTFKNAKKARPQEKRQTIKKEMKTSNAEEKKELRKKLLTGKIDQETYEEEMKKLN